MKTKQKECDKLIIKLKWNFNWKYILYRITNKILKEKNKDAGLEIPTSTLTLTYSNQDSVVLAK